MTANEHGATPDQVDRNDRQNSDSVPPGTPDAAENTCRRCAGTGKLENGPCPDCDGTGIVITPLGGAG